MRELAAALRTISEVTFSDYSSHGDTKEEKGAEITNSYLRALAPLCEIFEIEVIGKELGVRVKN